jgi:hypothetical protein
MRLSFFSWLGLNANGLSTVLHTRVFPAVSTYNTPTIYLLRRATGQLLHLISQHGGPYFNHHRSASGLACDMAVAYHCVHAPSTRYHCAPHHTAKVAAVKVVEVKRTRGREKKRERARSFECNLWSFSFHRLSSSWSKSLAALPLFALALSVVVNNNYPFLPVSLAPTVRQQFVQPSTRPVSITPSSLSLFCLSPLSSLVSRSLFLSCLSSLGKNISGQEHHLKKRK